MTTVRWRSPRRARLFELAPATRGMTNPLISMYSSVPLALRRVHPCPSRERSCSSFLHSTPVTHWKIYRGCCLYPAKIYSPRGAQDRRRRCTSPSDSNWHIIRRKFPPCLFILLLFYPIVAIIYLSFSADVTAPEPSGIAIDVFILARFPYTYLFVLLVSLSMDCFFAVSIPTMLLLPQYNFLRRHSSLSLSRDCRFFFSFFILLASCAIDSFSRYVPVWPDSEQFLGIR